MFQAVFAVVLLLCGVVVLARQDEHLDPTCFAPQGKQPSFAPQGKEPSFAFTVYGSRNTTGHWEAEVVMAEGAQDPRKNGGWVVTVDRSAVDHKGRRQVAQIKATTTSFNAALSRHGYEFFPGVGYYKLHTVGRAWDDAQRVCADEGGHLAVLNSESESGVLQELLARVPDLGGPGVAALVGFHDKLVEGQYVTIYDEPLESTGFERWSTHYHQPDDSPPGEDCGSVHRNGGLNDFPCEAIAPFFCEKELRRAFSSFIEHAGERVRESVPDETKTAEDTETKEETKTTEETTIAAETKTTEETKTVGETKITDVIKTAEETKTKEETKTAEETETKEETKTTEEATIAAETKTTEETKTVGTTKITDVGLIKTAEETKTKEKTKTAEETTSREETKTIEETKTTGETKTTEETETKEETKTAEETKIQIVQDADMKKEDGVSGEKLEVNIDGSGTKVEEQEGGISTTVENTEPIFEANEEDGIKFEDNDDTLQVVEKIDIRVGTEDPQDYDENGGDFFNPEIQ